MMGFQVEAHAIRSSNAEGNNRKWYKKEATSDEWEIAQKMTYLLKGLLEKGNRLESESY